VGLLFCRFEWRFLCLWRGKPSPEIDDELFNEVYGKAYSGPVQPATNSVTPKANDEKGPMTGDKSDEPPGSQCCS
jgi:hypothetical protein